MNMTRREIIRNLLASGAFFALPRGWSAEEKPLLTLGLISDTHVKEAADVGPLAEIFQWYAGRKVDAMVNCGDVCEIGSLQELSFYMDAWKQGFGATAPEHIVVWGNHDYKAASYMRGKVLSEAEKADSIKFNRDGAWKILYGEKHPGEVFLRKVKGYDFVCAHWKGQSGVPDFIRQHKVDTSKLFFEVEHSPVPGTVVPESAGAEKSKLRGYLETQPNCLSLSGHIHCTLADPHFFWRGGFAAITCGSTKKCAVRKGRGPSCIRGPINGTWGTRQGAVLTVYPEYMTLERHSFAVGRDIAPATKILLPLKPCVPPKFPLSPTPTL